MGGDAGASYAVTTGGAHIAYRIFGSGQHQIAYIPPWMSSVEFDTDDPYLGPALRRLASIGTMVMYDKRGCGMSDPLEPDTFPSLEARMDELVAVLDEAQFPRPTIFTGADGSSIAVLFAATYPERVHGLCLYAPFARAQIAPDYSIGRPRAEIDAMAAAIAATWGKTGIAPTAPSMETDPAFLEWVSRYQRLSASPQSAERFLRMVLLNDVRDLLPTIRVPTVVLHRADDSLVDVEFGRYVASNIPGASFIELPGRDHFWAVGDTEPIFAALAELATGAPVATPVERVLTTVLFTDIVGSTQRAVELGDRRWKQLLDRQHRTLTREITRHGGRLVASTGDGVLATFDGPGRAISCAAAIRDAVRSHGLEIRAGIHTGEIELRDDDVAGVAVHIAARVCALAGAGEVLVSGAVPPLVFGSGIEFTDRGQHDLKGVPGRWQIYEVVD
jgi:class 3 adenylate cyclase